MASSGESVQLRWNTAAYAEFFGHSGPVAAWLERLGGVAEAEAKRAASGRPGPNVITGRLRDSITHKLGIDGQGLYCDVGTNVPYGLYLELGTVNMPPYPFLMPGVQAAFDKIGGF